MAVNNISYPIYLLSTRTEKVYITKMIPFFFCSVYFGPALDPPLGGSGRKTTTLVREHEYFIPTKFHQNPSSGSGEEVENVKSLRTDGRTDDGRCTMTIAHSSLRLRWAKKAPFPGTFSKNSKNLQYFNRFCFELSLINTVQKYLQFLHAFQS